MSEEIQRVQSDVAIASVPTQSEYGSYVLSELRCPRCQGHVYPTDRCHTWPGGLKADGSTQWMSCMGCYSATEFECIGEEDPEDPDFEHGCGWSYIWGLNPHNPRSVANETSRPTGPEWTFLERMHP